MASKSNFTTKQQSTRQNVRVVCRVRPTNQKEISSGGVTCIKINQSNIDVSSEGGQNTFAFDRLFGPESHQQEVFQDTAFPLIADVLAGYNATIFAYGQTGTGKVSFLYLFTISFNIFGTDSYNGRRYYQF
jgi:kinesin family protein 11